MRSSRSLRLSLLLFACSLAVVGLLRAQETAPPEPSPPPAEGEKRAADDAANETPSPADAEGKPVKSGPSPGRFEPSEKVRADFDVSFPVDI